MFWMVTDKSRDIGQPVRKRRPESTAIAGEAETCCKQRLYLFPLLQVFGRWRFERTPHFMDFPAATRAHSRKFLAGATLKILRQSKQAWAIKYFGLGIRFTC